MKRDDKLLKGATEWRIRMKKLQGFILCTMLFCLISVLFLKPDTAFAATPSFSDTTLTLEGIGEAYQLTINNKVDGSKYKWYTSKDTVATVNSKGVITTVGKGSATISCKITYSTGKTKKLTCKLTVLVPATEVKINNATEVNGAHIIMLGESYDFNRDITPSNSSDKTYWSIGGGDTSCIRVDDETKGKITATKVGKVILKATASKKATAESAALSFINDAIIIEVVGPTATVHSIDITDSTELKIVFDCQIDESTVIGTNNKLLDSISVDMKKDTKGVLASDPGTLTAKLSTDKKTLIITPSKGFTGVYGINVSSKVKSISGIAMEEYYKQIAYVDITPPDIKQVTVDDTGLVCTIEFTEAMDFTNLKVSNVNQVTTTTSSNASSTTISILSNRLNYIASTDNKSLTINLANIASTDMGKIFSVILSGLKDTAGNSPANYTLTAYVYTDNSTKAQANPYMVTRTGYNTLTAYFDRGVKTAGYATINNGTWIQGVVDTSDSKMVHYTMSDTDAALSGSQTVGLIYWNGFNVSTSDTSNTNMKYFSTSFAYDKSSPALVETSYDSKTKVLTLTYNKEVTLAAEKGYLTSILTTTTDDIIPNTSVTYEKVASDNTKVIKLVLSNMTLYGTYVVTLPQGFVVDGFKNISVEKSIPVSTTGNVESELLPPYSISQDKTNLSLVYVDFANKIDVATASVSGNYTIAGIQVLNAKVEKNTAETGARVVLTIADDSIEATLERPVTIVNVQGYNGSYAPMTSYTTNVLFKENKKPVYTGITYDKTSLRRIILTFNEDLTGTATFKVTQILNSYSSEITNTVTVSGKNVYIDLASVPSTGTYLKIEVTSNSLADTSGNQATLQSTLGVVASY